MDDIKLFAKNEKESKTQIQTVRIYKGIGMEFGVEKCTMPVKKSGKRHDDRNRTHKSRKK